MSVIHIVGAANSFTHSASVRRYGEGHEFVSYEHHQIVAKLLAKDIPQDEPSIVPLWNSNAGIIDMDKQTDTASLFSGDAGKVYDLWAEPIKYGLSIPTGELTATTRFYSVKVAKYQCSKFLSENGINVTMETERFIGFQTTTHAMESFLNDRNENDGILCGLPLLEQHKQSPTQHTPTNPNNMTVFAVIGCLPNGEPVPTAWALQCFVTPIEAHELPTDFVDYYDDLVGKAINKTQGRAAVDDLPKVVFIVRNKDKAQLLIESPGEANVEDWERSQADSEVMFRSVGALKLSYSSQTGLVMQRKLGCGTHVFYGVGNVFMWVSPILGIAVHGYDKDMVRDCARMQVLKFVELTNAGKIVVSEEIQSLLELAQQDLSNLQLSPDSEPLTP